MGLRYLVEIPEPHTHIVKISISGKKLDQSELNFFLPSWSPGSYLMREYSKNLRTFKASDAKGKRLFHEQTAKGQWIVSFDHEEFKSDSDEFKIEYEMYSHELTVRNSHVDDSHAFLHGPSLFMGLKGVEEQEVEIEFKFPPLWSKLTTSMSEASDDLNKFIYKAQNYDELLDCPIEIGCHETDGFMVDGKEHHLAFYGETYPHDNDLKRDIKKIVEYVSSYVGEVPYDNYYFITHFIRNKFGGLEHSNSTALQFDGRKLGKRQDYIQWLALVAHEYFHTWNVKRIRPVELGPFDYTSENYTTMLWLVEGLTSFVDELFVYQSGLCTLEEYLKMQKDNFTRYYSVAGRKFHSLEQGSFNAWIKLYRPDENTKNSTVSYYLKGGLVFSLLNIKLQAFNHSIKDVVAGLWERYKKNPKKGVTTQEVLELITSLSDKKTADTFYHQISSTEEIDFEADYKEIGLGFKWEHPKELTLGVDWDYQGDRVLVKTVHLDGAAYKCGLNAGDEVLAINRQRFLQSDVASLESMLKENTNYLFTLTRLEKIIEIDVSPEKKPRQISAMVIEDKDKVESALKT